MLLQQIEDGDYKRMNIGEDEQDLIDEESKPLIIDQFYEGAISGDLEQIEDHHFFKKRSFKTPEVEERERQERFSKPKSNL